MKITEKTLKTIEFDKIREMLASVCPTEGSKAEARALAPEYIADRAIRRQKRTTDAKRLADAKGMPSFGLCVHVCVCVCV